MADLEGYKSWLSNLQREKRSFANNYYCAILARDMEENRKTEPFKIPYFIVEEELLKEDNNVNLANTTDAKVSNILRIWLIHLLKPYENGVNFGNYEEVLRSFLERDSVLPTRITHPLTPSTSFHCLPTECKLWILYTLRNHGKSARTWKPLTKDQLGNCYTIIPDSRLYVYSSARSEESPHLIDEETLCEERWGSLYRFVNAQSCQLVCEDMNGWDVVWKAILKFNLRNVYNAINADMRIKLSERSSSLMMRDIQRKEFEEFLSKQAPVPKTRTVMEMGIQSDTHEARHHVNTLQADLEAVRVEDPATLKKTTRRCWDFPGCPLNDNCPNRHPKVRCNKFPDCSSGWRCKFLHLFCPNDGSCVETNCAYEHLVSQKTFYRASREPEDEKCRPVASVQPIPITREVSDMEYTPIDKTPKKPAALENKEKAEKRRRCKWFPQCKYERTCRYWHPKQECRNFGGKKCPGKWCNFVHPKCDDDGDCEDLECTYEHHKSTTALMRRHPTKKNTGSLSRATSVSNLSTCSARFRRMSVTGENNSDYESARSSPVNKMPDVPKKFCNFLRFCAKKATCKYQHPHEPCPKFPCCPNGALCCFLHEVCPNDGVCSKEDCAYEHILPHRIGKRWCNNKSQCRKLGCTFIHPKTCTAPCPTPDDCWMYHPPAPPQPFAGPGFAPGPGPYPGYGPGPGQYPGYGPPPTQPFMPLTPDSIRYGFGPDFASRPPGPGYPPGSAPRQGGYRPHGPGFPSHGAAGHYPNMPTMPRPTGPPPPLPPRPNQETNEKRTRDRGN